MKNKKEVKKKREKRKVNWKIIIYSVIALFCLLLVYTISWWFIIPAVILMILNQRELNKK
jgi:plastocyanin domain-containing protein